MNKPATLRGEVLWDPTQTYDTTENNFATYHSTDSSMSSLKSQDLFSNNDFAAQYHNEYDTSASQSQAKEPELSPQNEELLEILRKFHRSKDESDGSQRPLSLEFGITGNQIRVSMNGGTLAQKLKFASALATLDDNISELSYYEGSSSQESALEVRALQNSTSENSSSYKSLDYSQQHFSPQHNNSPPAPPHFLHGSPPSFTLATTQVTQLLHYGVGDMQLYAPQVPFAPSRELVGGPRYVAPQVLAQAARQRIHINPNYGRDIDETQVWNLSAEWDENTSLLLRGIPVGTPLKEVFGLIWEGKVFGFSVKKPIPGKYDTCAATLIFTTRTASEAFLARSEFYDGIIIGGERIEVEWNRDACREQPYAERVQSRVVQFKGPQHLLSGTILDNFFQGKLAFGIVNVREWIARDGDRIVEVGFTCIRGQSRAAMLCFRRDIINGRSDGHLFKVQYAPDPCDP